jgi:signal peptidase I
MKLLRWPSFFPERLARLFHHHYVPHETRQMQLFLCIGCWSALSFWLVSHFIVGTVQVDGVSMEPTLHDSERFIVHHWATLLRAPRRYEFVVLRDNLDENLCIKRVIALPGETVEFRHGRVWVNGQPLDEPYLPPVTTTWEMRSGGRRVVVPEGHFFVLGDNRGNSVDSRYYGALARRQILGTVNP